MTYEQYWEYDPWLAVYCREAHRLKNQQTNQEMWMQGLYFREAMSVVLHNALKKKSDKEIYYPKEPFALTEKESNERKERDDRIARAVAKTKFEVWTDTLKLPTNGGETDGNND